MTTWRLLKLDGSVDAATTYHEVGTHESEHNFTIGYNAAQQIGAYHGPGEYLLLGEDDRFKTIQVGVRREFYELIPEEPEETEPVSLTVAPSAADVMQRDG